MPRETPTWLRCFLGLGGGNIQRQLITLPKVRACLASTFRSSSIEAARLSLRHPAERFLTLSAPPSLVMRVRQKMATVRNLEDARCPSAHACGSARRTRGNREGLQFVRVGLG